ncbi:unnamed protein product, partial [Rotaria sp. Silwood2]
MTIDPTVSSTPFASIREVSYFKEEEEILFSMHSVFRIGDVRQIDKKSPLYEVDLKLTSDDDEQLRELTDYIRGEVGGSGWHRMGQLLLKIGQFNKGEELYNALLERAAADSDRAYIYHMLGMMKNGQGQYQEAILFHDKALEIDKQNLSEDDLNLSAPYNNI